MVIKKFLMKAFFLLFLFNLVFAQCRVTVIVRDERNQPIENALISFNNQEYYTNSNGRVVFNFPYNIGRITISKEGYITVEREIRCPPCHNPINVRVVLRKLVSEPSVNFGCPVFLQFFDECDNCGIKDVKVYANGKLIGKTDENGVISFFVSYGNVQIYATKQGYHPFLSNYACVNGVVIDESIFLKPVRRCICENICNGNDGTQNITQDSDENDETTNCENGKWVDFDLELEIEKNVLEKGEKTLIVGKIIARGNDFPKRIVSKILLNNDVLKRETLTFYKDGDETKVFYVLDSSNLELGSHYVTLQIENDIKKSITKRIVIKVFEQPEKPKEKEEKHCLNVYGIKNLKVEKMGILKIYVENCGNVDESNLIARLIIGSKLFTKKIGKLRINEIKQVILSFYVDFEEKEIASLEIKNENVSITTNFFVIPIIKKPKLFLYFPSQSYLECGIKEFEIKVKNYGNSKAKGKLIVETPFETKEFNVEIEESGEKIIKMFLKVPCDQKEFLVTAKFDSAQREGKIVIKRFEIQFPFPLFLIPIFLISILVFLILRKPRKPCQRHPQELTL